MFSPSLFSSLKGKIQTKLYYTWNSLLVSILSADTVSAFKSCLQTHFYRLAFLPDNYLNLFVYIIWLYNHHILSLF